MGVGGVEEVAAKLLRDDGEGLVQAARDGGRDLALRRRRAPRRRAQQVLVRPPRRLPVQPQRHKAQHLRRPGQRMDSASMSGLVLLQMQRNKARHPN